MKGNRKNAKRLILASASPRRAELLRDAGWQFEVRVSPDREPARRPNGISVDLWPMCLAYGKAVAVRRLLRSMASRPRNEQASVINDGIILAADTIVVIDAKNGPLIFNKAANRGQAKRMLMMLADQRHRVITGICVMGMKNGAMRLTSAQAVCRISGVTGARLAAYLDSGLWKGKAGAYGIQDGDPFVKLLEGDMTTVIGLPMALVSRELADFERMDR